MKITTPVSKVTPWVYLVLVVPKKNGKVRVSLAPKCLNKAIRLAHYQYQHRRMLHQDFIMLKCSMLWMFKHILAC